MSGNLGDMRAYARGYEDGRRSKDADHAAVALRLSRLTFDGGSHENLHKIAYAIYPCATGWTCESSKGLRDRLIDLLGGVHEHCCDSGCGGTSGDCRAGDSGELAEAVTYDVLDNERNKAVCELRHIRDCLKGDSTINSLNIADAIGAKLNVGDKLHESICDRLIHLLGGDQPTLREIATELSQASVDAMSRRADQSHESSPMSLENETGITDELRECIETATKTYEGSWYEMNDADHTICHITEGELLGIADRMERRFAKAFISRSSELGCYKLHINQLEAERDQLRANLEEADAAIANWRERERSFDESERLREELQDELKELEEFEPDIAMTAYGDDNDELRRLLYRAAKLLANAEQERDANYAYWMDCKEKVVQANATIDELQAKLDAIREALDGDH